MKTNKAENYVTEITGMCSKYSVWEIWCDFINMCAISLANSCDKQQAPQREEVYLQIVKKYNRKELDIFCRLFANLVLDLEENPNQDLLGDIYGKLRMASKVHGQYFTPYHISKMMAKMIIGAEEEGPHIISEPTCGSGANIVAAANVMKENGFNYQQNAYFVAQDMDSLVAKMCFVQMALLGIPGVVIIGNTLDVNTKGMEHWYTPFHFLFGTWILQRHKRKLKKNQIEQKSNIAEQKDNWLLELVGLA